MNLDSYLLKDNNISTGYLHWIEPQLNDEFVTKAIAIFDKIQKTNSNKAIKKYLEDFEKLVKDRFGLNIITVTNTEIPLAIDLIAIATNPLIDIDIYKYFKSFLKSYKPFEKLEKFLINKTYTVDLKRVKVFGLDDRIKFNLYISKKTLKMLKDKTLTSKMLVALILHEIGHVFNALIYNNRLITHNELIIKALYKIKDGSPMQAIKVLEDYYKIDFKKSNNVEIFEKIKDELVFNNYIKTEKHIKENERLADSFAVYFGLGDQIAIGLERLGFDDERIENLKNKNIRKLFITLPLLLVLVYFIIFDLFYLLVFKGALTFILSIYLNMLLAVSIIVLILFIRILTGKDDETFSYDKLLERVNKLKTETISIIRTHKLSDDEKKKLIKVIEEIKENLENLKKLDVDNPVLTLFLNSNFGSVETFRYKVEDTINKLINNDMYYYNERIKQLSKN